jgi:hypothetical protein
VVMEVNFSKVSRARQAGSGGVLHKLNLTMEGVSPSVEVPPALGGRVAQSAGATKNKIQ